MTSERPNDTGTLAWVRSELDDTLQQAAQALNDYAEDASDRTQLRFCMTYLHQVYGTLQMLELYGLSGLVEDMEQSLDGLINGELENTDAMEEVLMRAILSVSDYLERIQRGEADSGLLVLPLRNELRSARGAEPLSESELFQPDLDKAPEEPRHERTQPSIIDIAHRRRHQYQRALLNYLRGQALERSLAQMQRILDELDAASGDDRSGDLWWIAAGVVDSLRHGDLAEAEGAVKRLLGQVDRQLKRVIDEGESVLREDPPRDILKDMLFYVGRSGAATDRVRAIQERFGLAPLRQDAESRSSGADSGGFRPGADILESVSSALREDITAVKDALDLFERSEHAEPERLEGAGDTLRRIGDTLGMLGLAAPRRAVRAQIEPVERLGRGEPGAEATCLEAARTLLYVESALDGLVATGATPLEPQGEAERGDATPDNEYLFELEYRSVHRTAISEALADIASLKEALVALTEGRDEDAPLTGLEPVLERLQGALDVIGLDRAGALVRDAGRFIREELISAEREIPQQRLDSLADAVTSLEYYLEAVLEDRGGRDRILEVAESSLGELGYAGTESDSGAAVADAATTSPSTADTSTLAADPSDGEDIVAAPPPDAGDDQAADSSPDADETAATPAAEPGTTEPEAGEPESITPAGAGEQAASTQTPAGPPRQAQTGRSGGVDPNVAVLADDMDQEILDIYLEEIDECMETIQEAYPRWRGDPDNHDALVTIRRMFHTLKGSGRLAGALLVGELAWSVERMLNRVIDGLLPPGAEIFGVIDRTLEAIPELAVELRDGTQPGMDVRAIMQEAARLVDGEPPSGPGPGGSSAAEGTPPDPSASATDGGSPAATDPGAGATDTDSDAEQSADADADTSEPASADATPAGPDLAEPAGDATADEVAAPDAAREVSQETPGDHGASEIGAEHSESPAETDSDEDAPAPEPSVTPESAAADDESGIAGDDASAASVADAAAETSEAAFGSDQEEDAAQDPEAAPAETDDGPAPGDMGDTAAAAEGPALDAEAHTATDASPADAPEPGVVVMDPTLYEIFRNEATDHLGTVRAFLGDAQGATQAHPTEDLVRSLHTLSGSARMADVVPVAALARDLEHLAANRQEQHEPLDETALDLLARGADTLEAMVTAIGNAEPLPDAGAIHEGIADAAREAEQPTASDAPEAGEAGTEPTPGADSDPDSAAVTEPEDASAATEAAGAGTVTQAPDTETHAHEAIDPDLVALFLEEAEDILGHLDQTMENLEDNPEDPATLSDIQRSLHTLKGGARLARFDAVANLCHVMEQRFADMEANRLPADDDVLSALRAGYDALVGMGVTARERGASGDAPEVLRRLQELGGAGAGRDA
ncbi:MAG: Hpt domain-containing protein, partial [Ectothiorhodospiraceae bacterium]